MSVTITKTFWNSTSSTYDAISKIVFTSPNIDSPASAGTRSYILPGSSYIGTWYESVALMHRIEWNQNAPNMQESYFAKLYINQDEDFNFNTDTSVSIRTPYSTTFSTGQIVSYDRSQYGVVSSYTSGGTVSIGGTLIATPFADYPLDGPTCCDGSYIYRAKINSTKIYRYDITNNYWSEFVEAPAAFTANASIAKEGNSLYCIQGATNVFWKYDISSDVWYTLRIVPTTVDSYTFIKSFDSGSTLLFMKAGDGSGQSIYQYDVSLNLWSTYFTPTLAGYTQVWYGPAIYYIGGYYYTWAVGKISTTVDLMLVKMDIGGLTTTKIGSTVKTYNTGGSAVNSVYVYGDYIDDVGATISGTDVHKILSHYNITIATTANTGFTYAINYDSGFDYSGEYVMPASGTGFAKCFDGDDLSFQSSDDIKPDVASICADGTYFYISERETASSGTYMYGYNLLVSGTNDYNNISCDTTNSFLAGESDYSETCSNIIYNNDFLYHLEGQYSNSLWKHHTISGTINNSYAYSETSSSGTDRYFTNQPYSCITTDGSAIFAIKGYGYSNFYKRPLISGSWTKLTDTLYGMGEYSSIVYVSAVDSIYAIQGKDSNALWRYDVASDLWYTRTGAPASFGERAVLHYPVYGGDYIYAIRGNGYNSFWRYSIVTNTWSNLNVLTTYSDLACGLISRGSSHATGKLYAINGTSVYEYTVSTGLWEEVDGSISYSDSYKKFTGDGNDGNVYIIGDDGIKSFELDDLSSAGSQYAYTINFSSVVGTDIVDQSGILYSWKDGIANSSLWSHAQNTIVFQVTNGEAYNCRLTAWDDETHTTTTNQILDDEHYKVVAVAYKAYSGTKQAPQSDDGTDVMVYPCGIDVPLKGNTKYFGDFDLIHIANGGLTGSEHGEYLIFTPRLHGMDSSFSSGNYDFVTTLHYQYT